MELNNTEQEIKKAFHNRTIQPSPVAKERLEALLLASEKKEKRNSWMVWIIAASVCIALVVTGLKGEQHKSQKEKPQITFENEFEHENKEHSDLPKLNESITLETNDTQVKPVRAKDINGKVIHKTHDKATKTGPAKISENRKPLSKAYVHIKTIKENEVAKQKTSIVDSAAYLNLESLDEAIGVVESKQVPNDSNYLIEFSQKHSTTEYVNPDDLLSKMENQIFLEKNKGILERVGKRLKKIKEVVANRNYEKNKL